MVAPPGRKPIAEHWRERIRWYAANYPGMSSREIARRLQEEAERSTPQRDDWPSERSVRRIRPEVDEAQVRRRYLLANWPDAFGTDSLPWESAGAVKELTGMLGRTPEVTLASWYWRLRQRWPDGGLDDARAATPEQKVAGIRDRQRLSLAWASAFTMAELVPGWTETVSERLNDPSYSLKLDPGRDAMLDSGDMGHLIRGERLPTRRQRLGDSSEVSDE